MTVKIRITVHCRVGF